MKKALLIGNFGAQNVGDELILQGLLSVCERENLVPIVVSAAPRKTRKMYHVLSVPRLPFGLRSLFRNWISTFVAYMKSDLVILGGGGLFVDRLWRAPLLWWIHGAVAVFFRKPLYLVGHSFELKSRFFRRLLRSLCRKARFISVRDRASLLLLKELGIAPQKCFVFPDLCFLAPHEHSEPKKFIGVSLCKWGIAEGDLAVLSQFLSRVVGSESLGVRLFAFQGGTDDDLKLLKSVRRAFPKGDCELVASNDHHFLRKFGECSFIVGMRLHSILLATSFGIPFIAIAYQDKVRNCVDDLGLRKYCLFPQAFHDTELFSLYRDAVSDKRFSKAGLQFERKKRAFLSTISSFL